MCVVTPSMKISTQEWKWKQLSAFIQRIYERRRGEAYGMKRSQIKWKLLLFDESDFFLFLGQFIFYSHLREPCDLFSRKSRNMYFFLNQTRFSNGQA